MCSVSLTDTEDMCVSVDHSSSPMGEKRVETTSVIAASLENVHPRTRTSSQFHSFVSPFVGVRWDMSSAPYQDVSGDSTCLHDCLITGLFGNLFLWHCTSKFFPSLRPGSTCHRELVILLLLSSHLSWLPGVLQQECFFKSHDTRLKLHGEKPCLVCSALFP